MFTGLVETMGTVLEYNGDSSGATAVFGDCASILGDVNLGDSISTNGVCLTVTHFDDARTQFSVGIAPETLRRSTLGALRPGDKVNLERAVKSDVRMGGHVVQGHVDTVATIVQKVPDGTAVAFTFRLRDRENIDFVVEKGFVAVDGASLTVTGVDHQAGEFSVMLVDYTQSKVITAAKVQGDAVNVEVDYTGKVIARQIDIALEGQLRRPDSALARFILDAIERRLKAAWNAPLWHARRMCVHTRWASTEYGLNMSYG